MSIYIYLRDEDLDDLHGHRSSEARSGNKSRRVIALGGRMLAPDVLRDLALFERDEYTGVSLRETLPIGAAQEGEATLGTASALITSMVKPGIDFPYLEILLQADTIEAAIELMRQIRSGNITRRRSKGSFTRFQPGRLT